MQNHKNKNPVIEYHPNGKVKSEKNIKNLKAHGVFAWWYKNGQKEYEVNYKDGDTDGMTSWWHENGQKGYELKYKDGVKHGIRIFWYESGQKEMEEYCILDEKYARIDWDEEGNVIKTEIPTPPLPTSPIKTTKTNHKTQSSRTNHAKS